MPSYLALGDSYTIGEGIDLPGSFPYQAVQLLRKRNIAFYAPEIIAKTGWTTDELSAALEKVDLLEEYDVVSLLIGVNDQYRGRSVKDFSVGFDHLLQRAIPFSGNRPGNVFVLSIPDWGITPFAVSRDREKIRNEIDAFNDVCKMEADRYNATFINITDDYRKEGMDPDFIAPDGLHPSAKEYAKWAEVLANKILASKK